MIVYMIFSAVLLGAGVAIGLMLSNVKDLKPFYREDDFLKI